MAVSGSARQQRGQDPAVHGLAAGLRPFLPRHEGVMEQLRGDAPGERLDGGRVPTTVILVPIALGGALMALHFVTPR